MPKYRKKPVVIEAFRFAIGNAFDISKWCDGKLIESDPVANVRQFIMEIDTLEGTMTANLGDWIIRGVMGEFYPCKHDIFEESYEAA